MRIALVAEDYYPQVGGIAEHVHNLAVELQAAGHSVGVIGSRMKGSGAHDRTRPYPVYRIGRSILIYANGGVSRLTVGWQLGRQLHAVLRSEQFDLVHLHAPLAFTLGVITPPVVRRCGLPLVGTFHSWFPRSALYRVFRAPLQRRLDVHDAVIAVSAPVVQAHARYFRAQWHVIPNGVNTAQFTVDGRRAPDAVAADGPVLLYLHRLEPRNNLRTLLQAMPEILRAYPRSTLIVAGDGPWLGEYARQARHLGERVRFVGRVRNPADWYRIADLYLCPTMRAGFGITLLEAMACGTPIIAADNPGFRSVLDGGKDGIQVAHDRPDQWARAVIDVLNDPARRRSMRAAGIAKAREHAWPTVTRRIMAVYERVVRS